MRSLIVLILIIFISSCSFNKIYLRPTKNPVGAKTLTIKSDTDTNYVTFDPVNFSPAFLNSNKDTIISDFTIESVVFLSSNGHKLNGWMMKPRNSKPKITLIHFHGNGGNLLFQYQAMTPLLKFDFQIFTFDYSGFGFSEGKSTRKNIVLDANAALGYVKSRSDVKNTKVVIYGQSLGGHLAAVVGSLRQADIDGLVVEGAFSSHRDIAAESAGVFGRILVSEHYSAYKSIRTYKKPLLVIHSSEDNVIPFKMGKKIFENGNQPKEFYEIKKCHICGPKFYADSISLKIYTMLKLN